MPTAIAGGRYHVQRFIGEGAKKRVYLAHDTRLDRDVAIALIKTEGLDDAGLIRVRREAQAMGRLGDHPHIVTVYDTGDEAGQPYIVSQHMAGGSVDDLLQRARNYRPPLDQVLRTAEQICQALEHAHARSVVHRDLKPGNVWLTADGTAKLGDFGLAVAFDRPRLTAAGMMVGTVAYMPPEQALGRPPEARSDLYSLGAMLYEMVTGRPPFLGDDAVAIISQHINTPPVAPSWHNPEVPRALEALILRLLSKAPEERPENATAVRQALLAIRSTASIVAERVVQEEANPLDRLAAGVFVGREKEMDQLRAGLEETLSGHGQMLMLVGEPGIGKTRTAEELTTYARLRTAQVLWGRCYEGEGAPAFWPWVQVVRAYVRDRDPKALMSEMGPGAADIAQVVSEVRERLPGLPVPPPLEPEQARFRLFDSLTNFLKNASKGQPLVLVLDDLHWADKSSLLLLQFLARELRGARLLLLGTYRDVELRRQHPLAQTLGELNREGLSQRILLRGLTERDVARFIEVAAGLQPPEALVAAVYRETEGNPFFVNEVVRLLVADRRIEHAADVKSWSVTIPQSVREVVGRRLDHLSEECNRVLTIASVIGREFGVNAVERVVRTQPAAPLHGDRLLEAIEEAVGARVINEVPRVAGRYSFSHALIRETLYEELSTTRRVQVHRQIGEVLEDLYHANLQPHLAELAYHFSEAAQGGDVDKAIDYAKRAGERAIASLAYEEAVGHYERALQAVELKEPVDEAARCEVVLGLANAQNCAGEHLKAMETFPYAADLARKLGALAGVPGAASMLARAAMGFAEARWVAQTPAATTIHLLDEALSVVGAGDSILRAQLLARLAMALFSASDARKETVSREALDMARRLGEPETLMWALGARRFAIMGPDTVTERLAIATDLVELAEKAESGMGQWGHESRMHDLLEIGDMPAALCAIDAAVRFAQKHRQAWMIALTVLYRGLRALLQGRFEECERLALEAFATGTRLQSDNVINGTLTQLFVLRWAQGRLAELQDAAEDGVKRSAEFPNASPLARIGRAFLYSQLGRASEARQEFEQLAASSFHDLPRDGLWLANLAMLSDICAFLGDARHAAILYELLRPYAARNVMVGVTSCSGPVARYLGLLADTMSRFDEAMQHFAAALALCARLEAPPFVAQTQYDYARARLHRGAPGDREEALRLVNQALGTARELGMKALVEKALALKFQVQGIDSGDFQTSIDAVAADVQHNQPDLRAHAAPDGTVTILFTDIVGSSALAERLGDQRWLAVLRAHNAIVREQVAAHGGFEVKSQGDGFMVAFQSARRALLCAVAVQRAVAAYSEQHPEEAIRVRIGLHTGEVIKEADDFFGKNVILAARIAGQASGGEILVSSLVKQLAESGGDIRFGEARATELKGLAGTYALHPVS